MSDDRLTTTIWPVPVEIPGVRHALSDVRRAFRADNLPTMVRVLQAERRCAPSSPSTTGDVSTTPCDSCDGVAVLGDRVVSLEQKNITPLGPKGACSLPDCGSNGVSYTLKVYNAELALQSSFPIAVKAPPPSGFPDEDHVYATLERPSPTID